MWPGDCGEELSPFVSLLVTSVSRNQEVVLTMRLGMMMMMMTLM